MSRTILSLLLPAFFILQPAFNARAAGAQTAINNSRAAAFRQQLQGVEPGTQIKVKLLGHNDFRGQLVSVGVEDFTMRTGEGTDTSLLSLRFEDIKSLKVLGASGATTAGRPRSKMSRRGKIMLVVGFAALIFGIVTYATTKGP
ncbi:MAG: hypothetical protein ACM3NO_02810, partial [Deltaproteobacteria bacterium]